MKISFQWLKEYVELAPSLSAEEVAHKLTFAGLEVEALGSLAKGFEKVVVGQILERGKHPGADRLSLTKIDVGTGTPLEIVCGAQNIAAGQKIPVATVGAHLPNGMEIKPAKIRGVPSQGMLCSLDELMLPKEWQAEDGIFQLDASAKIGTPLAEYLGRNDTILEINVTPNRGDALSHFGVARDVAALFGSLAKLPETKVTEKEGGIPVTVKNDAGAEACPAYHGRLIEGVKVGPSPDWLKKKLEAVGLRSINNVVDVTAFVMMEMGQPLHAFDADKLAQNGKIQIAVRAAKADEEFETLSDKKVKLQAGDILIASGADQHGVALAGVMGGKNSETDVTSKNIFLESAEFNPVRVRKTGRRLNLLTDAGYRYERGIDSGRVRWALDRATDLIVQVAGGVAHQAVSCAETKENPLPQVRLRLADIQRTLGQAPDLQKVIQILRGLGIPSELAAGEQNVVNVQVPRWRKDITRAIDLVEEIGRIWGYDQLESRLPLGGMGEPEAKDSRRRSYFQVRRVRRHLASLGFFEAMNYGFTSPEVLKKVHGENPLPNLVEIANPVNADYSVMKPDLLSGLLQNVQVNFSHKHKNLRFYEVRRVFSNADKNPDEARISTGVTEDVRIGLLLTGSDVDESWEGKPMPVDFYSLKGALESVFEILGLEKVQFQPGAQETFLHPGQSASILTQGKVVGFAGRLHPGVEKRFEIDQDVFYAELQVDALLKDDRRSLPFSSYSNFPVVERDFSALVKDEVTSAMIRSSVAKAAKPLLQDFLIFDVYRGARVPDGYVSYAFRIFLGASDHTLADAEIMAVQEKVMKSLEKDFGAKFAGIN